jgi:putative flippase GtrA
VSKQIDSLKKLFFELLRFGGVGGLTTVVYFVALWPLAKFVALPMWLLAFIACLPALLVGYLLHRSFTFKSNKRHASAGPRFLIVQLAGMAFNSFAIWVGTDLAHWPFLVVQFGAIALQVMLTYLGQKLFAFS